MIHISILSAIGIPILYADSIIIDPESKTVEASEQSYEIGINSDSSWVVSESLFWIEVDSYEGENDGLLTVWIQENTSIASRSGTISIGTEVHTITQAGVDSATVITPLTNEVEAATCSYEIEVESNQNWEVVEDEDWISTSMTQGTGFDTVTVTVEENFGSESRTTTIVIGDKTHELTQRGVGNPLYTYTSDGNSVVITGFNGDGEDVIIPDQINGMPVVAIDDYAFDYNSVIKSVFIPSTVVEIRNRAFRECSQLVSVTLDPGLQRIGDAVFENCNLLPEIQLPEGLLEINYAAFWGCSSLQSLTLPSTISEISENGFVQYCHGLQEILVAVGNTYYTSVDGVLYNSDQTELIAYPSGRHGEYTVPQTVEKIRKNSFYGCQNLTSFTTQVGLLEIEEDAVIYCYQLSQVDISSSVSSLSGRSFYGNDSLTVFNISDENPDYKSEDGVIFSKDGKRLLFCLRNKTGAYSIPEGVEVIEAYAFQDCDSITSVTFPDSLLEVESYAFQSCDGITSISINANLQTIGDSAFRRMYNLEAFDIQGDNPYYAVVDGVLFSADMRRLLGYPSKKTDVSYTIPSGVVIIEESAFYHCEELTEIIFPNSIRQIKYQAFWYCDSIAELTLPEGLEVVENYAFSYCRLISTVNIPSTVTNIGWDAFMSCDQLVAAIFKGPAPQMAGEVFYNVSEDFVIKVPENLDGYTTPTWMGYPSESYTWTGTIVRPSNKDVLNLGGVYDIEVYSNNELWAVTEDLDWVSVDRLDGNGEGTIEVNVSGNETGVDRTGTITVGTVTHTIHQSSSIGTSLPFISNYQDDGYIAGNELYLRLDKNGYDVDQWQVLVGSMVGGNDIYTGGVNDDWGNDTRDYWIYDLPSDGSWIYVTVKCKIDQRWLTVYSQFQTEILDIQFTNPQEYAVLASENQVFSWEVNTGDFESFGLSLGDWEGDINIFSSPDEIQESTYTVRLLPNDGEPLYATITGRLDGDDDQHASFRSDSIQLQSAPGSYQYFIYEYEDNYTYDWKDISTTGEKLSSDINHQDVELGFTFQYFGQEYDCIRLGKRGNLSFGWNVSSYWDGLGYSNIRAVIAPLSRDFYASHVFYDVIGEAPNRKAVFQWGYGNTEINSDDTHNNVQFQAILCEGTDDIIFQYKDIDFGDSYYDFGAASKVGIKNQDSTTSVIYSSEEAKLYNGQAIRFYNTGKLKAPSIPSLDGKDTVIGNSFNLTFDDAGYDISQWTVNIGSEPNATDIYQGYQTDPTNNNWVSGLPTDGSTVYFTLRYEQSGVWYDKTYEVATTPLNIEMLSPSPSNVLPEKDVTFVWTPTEGEFEAYEILIGSSPDSSDYYSSTSNVEYGDWLYETEHVIRLLPNNGEGIYVTIIGHLGYDEFGYQREYRKSFLYYAHSNEVGLNRYEYDDTVPYNWIDATQGNLSDVNGNSQFEEIELGFPFEFYGQTYDRVRVGEYGFLTFNSSINYWSIQSLPSTNYPDAMIAPFKDRFNSWNFGDVYYLLEGSSPNRRLIIEWKDLYSDYGAPNSVNFQAILYEGSNDIVFQYKDVSFGDATYDAGAHAAIGIENQDGTVGVQYSYYEAKLTDEMAIRFYDTGELVKPEVWLEGSETRTTEENYNNYLNLYIRRGDTLRHQDMELFFDVSGTATFGEDWVFFLNSGYYQEEIHADWVQPGVVSINIPGGGFSYYIQAMPLVDNLEENTEEFTIALRENAAYDIAENSITHTTTILNSSGQSNNYCTLRLEGDTRIPEGEQTWGYFYIDSRKSDDTELLLEIGGGAVFETDYTVESLFNSGGIRHVLDNLYEVIIPAGRERFVFSIDGVNDGIVEPEESFEWRIVPQEGILFNSSNGFPLNEISGSVVDADPLGSPHLFSPVDGYYQFYSDWPSIRMDHPGGMEISGSQILELQLGQDAFWNETLILDKQWTLNSADDYPLASINDPYRNYYLGNELNYSPEAGEYYVRARVGNGEQWSAWDQISFTVLENTPLYISSTISERKNTLKEGESTYMYFYRPYTYSETPTTFTIKITGDAGASMVYDETKDVFVEDNYGIESISESYGDENNLYDITFEEGAYNATLKFNINLDPIEESEEAFKVEIMPSETGEYLLIPQYATSQEIKIENMNYLPPEVGVKIPSYQYQASEGGLGYYDFIRNNGSTGYLNVYFHFTGDAIFGEDFLIYDSIRDRVADHGDGLYSFLVISDTQDSLSVVFLNDDVRDPGEFLGVELVEKPAYTILSRRESAEISILDDPTSYYETAQISSGDMALGSDDAAYLYVYITGVYDVDRKIYLSFGGDAEYGVDYEIEGVYQESSGAYYVVCPAGRRSSLNFRVQGLNNEDRTTDRMFTIGIGHNDSYQLSSNDGIEGWVYSNAELTRPRLLNFTNGELMFFGGQTSSSDRRLSWLLPDETAEVEIEITQNNNWDQPVELNTVWGDSYNFESEEAGEYQWRVRSYSNVDLNWDWTDWAEGSFTLLDASGKTFVGIQKYSSSDVYEGNQQTISIDRMSDDCSSPLTVGLLVNGVAGVDDFELLGVDSVLEVTLEESNTGDIWWITIPEDTSQAVLAVKGILDDEVEGVESLQLEVQENENYIVNNDADTIQLYLLDLPEDQPVPEISIYVSSDDNDQPRLDPDHVGSEGSVSRSINIQRDRDYPWAQEVYFQLDGSAEKDTDYSFNLLKSTNKFVLSSEVVDHGGGLYSTIIEPASNNVSVFLLSTFVDKDIESDETFRVSLVDRPEYTIDSGYSYFQETIEDRPWEDPVYALALGQDPIREGGDDTYLLLYCYNGYNYAPFDLYLEISGSANLGDDFSFTNMPQGFESTGVGEYVFRDFDGYEYFYLSAIADEVVEADEYVRFSIVESDDYLIEPGMAARQLTIEEPLPLREPLLYSPRDGVIYTNTNGSNYRVRSRFSADSDLQSWQYQLATHSSFMDSSMVRDDLLNLSGAANVYSYLEEDEYFWRVRVNDVANNQVSPWSEIWSFDIINPDTTQLPYYLEFFRPGISVPDRFDDLVSLDVLGADQMMLSWVANDADACDVKILHQDSGTLIVDTVVEDSDIQSGLVKGYFPIGNVNTMILNDQESGVYVATVRAIRNGVESEERSIKIEYQPLEFGISKDVAVLSEENQDVATVILTRDSFLSYEATVQMTLGGSATYGEDYSIVGAAVVNGVVNLPFVDRQDNIALQIQAIDDALLEGTESIVITLMDGDGYQVSSLNSVSIAITETDVPGYNVVGSLLTDGSAEDLAVNIIDAFGSVVGSATSDADGMFAFDRISDGRYRIFINGGNAYASIYSDVVVNGGNIEMPPVMLQSNLLVNGSFEDTLSAGDVVESGGTFEGWSVSTGSVRVYDSLNPAIVANEGELFVELKGISEGVMQQVFRVNAGQSYLLSFRINNSTLKSREIDVKVGDFNRSYTCDPTTNGAWVRHSLVFEAQSDYETLSFTCSVDSESEVGILIDNIQVFESPSSALWGAIINQAKRNGHQYLVIGDYFGLNPNWEETAAIAESFGGHLAIIGDQEEQSWVESQFADYLDTGIWIGISDFHDTDGVFTWVDGTSIAYNNWADGQPVNTVDVVDPGYMASNGEWFIADETSEMTKPGLIEIPQILSFPDFLEMAIREIEIGAIGANDVEVAVWSNFDWDIENLPSWLTATTVEKGRRDVIVIDVAPNNSTATRVVELMIGGKSFKITQKGQPPVLEVSIGAEDVGNDSGSFAFDINANVSWSIDESASWLSVQGGETHGNASKSVIIEYEENLGFSDRSATIQVGNNAIKVTQSGNWELIAANQISTSIVAFDDRVIGVGISAQSNLTKNGDTWDIDELSNPGFYSIAYEDGFYLAGGPSKNVKYSYDGNNWHETSATSPTPTRIFYLDDQWYAVSIAGGMFKSDDGLDWSAISTGTNHNLSAMCMGDGVFVAVGENGTILKSSEGENWTTVGNSIPSDFDASLRDVIFAGGKFVAVGEDAIITSNDGENWSIVEIEGTLNSVAFVKNKFLGVGNNGLILISRDAVDWVEQSFDEPVNLYDISVSALGLFVAGDTHWIRADVTGVSQPADLDNFGLTIRGVKQKADSKLVDIYYNLLSASQEAIDVQLHISSDGGVSFDSPVVSTAAGDIGDLIKPGIMKHITWNAGLDWPQRSDEYLVARITATRGDREKQANSSFFALDTTYGPNELPKINTVSSRYINPDKSVYFIKGVDVIEELEVSVDWNGNTPGHLQFIRSGIIMIEDSMTHTYNMGVDFEIGESLYVKAVTSNGVESLPYRVGFEVIPVPGGLDASILSVNQSSTGLRYSSEVIDIDLLDFTSTTISHNVVIFGGETISIEPQLQIQVSIDGSGRASSRIASSSNTAFNLGAFEVTTIFSGGPSWSYDAINGWQTSGSLKMTGKKSWPSDPVGVWENPPIYFNTEVDVDTSFSFDFDSWNGVGDAKLSGEWSDDASVSGIIGAGVSAITSIDGYLTGGPSWVIDMSDANPVNEVRIVMQGEIKMTSMLWFVNEQLDYSWTWDGVTPLRAPLAMSAVAETTFSNLLSVKSSDYQLVDLNYKKTAAVVNRDEQGIQKQSSTVNSGTIASNVFRNSTSALSLTDLSKDIAFIDVDVTREDQNATQLYIRNYWVGSWGAVGEVDDDGTADFSPDIITGGDMGDKLIAWQNISRVLYADEGLVEALANSEIAVKTIIPTTSYENVDHFDTEGELDHSPVLAGDVNESILIWINEPDNDLDSHDPLKPTQIKWATYNNSAWTENGTLISGLGNLLWADAAWDGSDGVVVYAIDEDNDLTTTSDQEIYALEITDGVPAQSPVGLPQNSVQDTRPQATYDSNGELLVTWFSDGNLMFDTDLDFSDANTVGQMGTSTASIDYQLITGPNGEIGAIWSALNQGKDVPDIFILNYDPILGTWSSPFAITSGDTLERSISGGFTEDGNLNVAYSNTVITMVSGVPEFGRVDIEFLDYEFTSDIAIEEGSSGIQESSFGRGDAVTIECVVVNSGSTNIEKPNISVYHGPVDESNLIETKTDFIALLRAGESTTVIFDPWEIPTSGTLDVINLYVETDDILESTLNNNAASFSFNSSDLSIDNVSYARSGNDVRLITAVVENTGTFDVSEVFAVEFRFGSPTGVLIERVEIQGLASGASYDVGSSVDLSFYEGGNTRENVYVILDADLLVKETDEENNVSVLEVVTNLDSDGDGILDADEQLYGTRIDLADTDGDGLNDLLEIFVYLTDPKLKDTDGDGSSDYAEILAGTDAKDINVSFKLLSMTPGSGNSLIITWTSKAGVTYQVISSTTLEENSWTLSIAKVDATGATTQVSVPASINGEPLFYKVRVQP